jgi:AraC-like DNA-binding protein
LELVPGPIEPSFLTAAAQRLLLAAAARGIPRAGLLETLGMDEARLADPDARIPASAMYATWEACMRSCRDDGFPMDMAKITSVSKLGLLGYVLYTRPTTGSALEALARYHDLVNDSGRWSIRHGEAETIIAWQRDGDRTLGMRVANEQVLAALVVVGKHTARGGIPIRRAYFRHGKPRHDEAHAQVFGVAPVWSAEMDALVIPREALDDKPGGANDVLSDYFATAAEQALARVANAGSWSARVARVVSASLGSGIPTLQSVARELGTSERTARRRLASEGVAFDSLVQRVQQENANELLAGTTHIRDIAFALGFSDTTAFSRAYRRWTGKAPTEARAELLRR